MFSSACPQAQEAFTALLTAGGRGLCQMFSGVSNIFARERCVSKCCVTLVLSLTLYWLISSCRISSASVYISTFFCFSSFLLSLDRSSWKTNGNNGWCETRRFTSRQRPAGPKKKKCPPKMQHTWARFRLLLSLSRAVRFSATETWISFSLDCV